MSVFYHEQQLCTLIHVRWTYQAESNYKGSGGVVEWGQDSRTARAIVSTYGALRWRLQRMTGVRTARCSLAHAHKALLRCLCYSQNAS